MRKKAGLPQKGTSFSILTWAFFTLCLTVNALLAYAPLPLEGKLWVALGGLLLLIPLAWQRRRLPPPAPVSGPAEAAIPSGLWAVFLLLLLFIHFFRPSTFPAWPLADDGRNAFFALDIARQWDGRIFWGETQGLPLSMWFFGLVYRLVPFNAVTFRMVPSLLSLAALAVAGGASRKLFPKSAAFYFTWLLGLGFWTLSFSRMTVAWNLYLILELGTLFALGRLIHPPSPKGRAWIALGLGVAAGLAYDTALIGKALLAVVVLALLFHFTFREKKGWKYPALFALAVLVFIAPVAMAELKPGGANYLLSQRAPGLNFNCLVALFWDGLNSAPYGPAWGGCFNPLVTSLALLGFTALWIGKRRPWALGTLLAGLVFLAPGLFSTGTEIFRVLNLLPLVLGLAAFGLVELAGQTPIAIRSAVVGSLLALSAGLDLYHYMGPYQQIPAVRQIWRNGAFASIDDRLEDCRRQGLRLGLLDFTVNDYDDHTLDVLTRSLDGFAGPEGGKTAVDQVALVADVHYRPFLEKRFPKARWFSFPGESSPGEPGWTLGLIPAGEMTAEERSQWSDAALVFKRVGSLRMYWQRYQSLEPILRDLLSQKASFEGDPFLQSVFWEEAALLFNIERNLPYALACYQRAIQGGYPAAQLYNESGVLEALSGRRKQALLDFRKATQAPLDRTTASANLQALEKGAP